MLFHQLTPTVPEVDARTILHPCLPDILQFPSQGRMLGEGGDGQKECRRLTKKGILSRKTYVLPS